MQRGELGFDGIINSDTGPIEMMPWGAEHLSIEQRYQKTLQAGINLYSGTADPTKLLATIRSGMVDMSRRGLICSAVRDAVTAVENGDTARAGLAKAIGLWRVSVAFGFVFDSADLAAALAGPT